MREDCDLYIDLIVLNVVSPYPCTSILFIFRNLYPVNLGPETLSPKQTQMSTHKYLGTQ